jgi:hypothetical protein
MSDAVAFPADIYKTRTIGREVNACQIEFLRVKAGINNFPYPYFYGSKVIFRIAIIIGNFRDFCLTLINNSKVPVEEKILLVGFSNIKDEYNIN